MDISNNSLPDAIPYADPPIVAAPTPNNPPWNSLLAIGVWIMSVLAIVIIPTLFILPYVLSESKDLGRSQAISDFLQSDPTAIILQVLAVIPAHVLTLALAWLVVTRLRTFSFRKTLGWDSGGMLWWHYALILIGFFAIAGVVGTYFPEQENELTRILRSSRWAVFLVAFMATFTAPLVEEVVYRGILYSAFQRTLGVWPAVATVTFLFALVHLPQYYPSHSTMFLLLLLSLILTLVRVKTDNLFPCIVLHTIFNAIQSVLLILEPHLPKIDEQATEAATALFK